MSDLAGLLKNYETKNLLFFWLKSFRLRRS